MRQCKPFSGIPATGPGSTGPGSHAQYPGPSPLAYVSLCCGVQGHERQRLEALASPQSVIDLSNTPGESLTASLPRGFHMTRQYIVSFVENGVGTMIRPATASRFAQQRLPSRQANQCMLSFALMLWYCPQPVGSENGGRPQRPAEQHWSPSGNGSLWGEMVTLATLDNRISDSDGSYDGTVRSSDRHFAAENPQDKICESVKHFAACMWMPMLSKMTGSL